MKRSYGALLVLLAVLFSAPGRAGQELGFARVAGDFAVYLTVMPSSFTAGGQPAPEPGATPYQAPATRDTHHVMVSIFEYPGGRRVTAATVTARVASLGFSGDRKALEPTSVAGATVFANSFAMIGRGPFRIDVELRVPSAQRTGRVTFYFTHPRFTPPAEEEAQRGKK